MSGAGRNGRFGLSRWVIDRVGHLIIRATNAELTLRIPQCVECTSYTAALKHDNANALIQRNTFSLISSDISATSQWLRGQDLHLRLEVMSSRIVLRYYRATTP